MNIIRGDTLNILIVRKDSNGKPLSGDAPYLKSQIRTRSGKLLASFSITETATSGTYLMSVPSEETEKFPTGVVQFDIEYRNNGTVISSEIIRLNVIGDVTRNE